MAERDKMIKSGQLTLPRLIFLAAVGGVIVATVALGGVYLTIGYWLLTIAICVLLYLVATDYGIKMDKVDLTDQPSQPATVDAAPVANPARAASGDARVKRRPTRPVKRRR